VRPGSGSARPAARTPLTACLVLAALLPSALASAASPTTAGPAPTFVTTDWLAHHLADPDLVVLHASGQRSDYDAGHVPGARFIGWAAYTVTRDSLSTELPVAARFDSLLEAAGVRDGSRIVIAGGPVTLTSRLLVTLDYFGLGTRASLLDGGIDAWREEGRPVSRDSVAVARGDVTLHPSPDRVVDAAWIAAHRGGDLAIVDARAPEFFEGNASNNNPRAGRLPGAGNVPFTWLTGELGRFRDRAAIERLFARAGARKGERVVTYCHIGIQASVAYVAARSLGCDVSLYDGSFEDWSRRAGLPVSSGPAAAPR
jgi:thiosulfate/3-mercaptopyruvate sulfurtransferase